MKGALISTHKQYLSANIPGHYIFDIFNDVFQKISELILPQDARQYSKSNFIFVIYYGKDSSKQKRIDLSMKLSTFITSNFSSFANLMRIQLLTLQHIFNLSLIGQKSLIGQQIYQLFFSEKINKFNFIIITVLQTNILKVERMMNTEDKEVANFEVFYIFSSPQEFLNFFFLFIKQQFMLNYFFSDFSSFESQLQEFFAQGPDSLHDGLLHKVMAILRGQDVHVKSQIAFAALRKAIASFNITKSEIRLLRELIIFDKLVEDHIYCEQISKITLFALESNKGISQSNVNANSLRLLRLYWKIIKDKSIVVNGHEHIFHQKRSLRRYYFQRLKLPVILNQLNDLQSFFASIFELAYHLECPSDNKQDEWRRGGVVQYVILHLLYKLLGLYNCQVMAHRYIIHKIAQLNLTQIGKLRKIITKFRQHCNKFINFIKKHHLIKGFQLIHYEEIRVEMNQKLIKFIDDSLQSREADAGQLTLKTLPVNMGKIIVEKKTMDNVSKSNYNSRLNIKNDNNQSNKKQKGQNNPFSNWHNGFSHQFPQKQVMTVDLIMQLKLEQTLASNNQLQDGQNNLKKEFYQSRCSYDNRSTNISSTYEVHYLARKQYSINVLDKVDFDNAFSRLPSKWNQI